MRHNRILVHKEDSSLLWCSDV